MTGFHLDRFPVRVEMEEYAQVAATIDDRLLSLPGVVAVYSIGGISAPGISDLDRIAVVEPDVERVTSIWGSLTSRERYVALHSPFLIDVGSFGSHRWFSRLEPLGHVAGDAVPVDDPPRAELLSRRLGVEHLVLARLKLEKTLFTGRIDVRPILCELNNIRRNLQMIGLSESSTPVAWSVAREVEGLRSKWWEIDDVERIERLVALPARAALGVDEALTAAGAETADRAETQRVPGYWSNVELAKAGSGTIPTGQGALGQTLFRGSRRLAELRWRSASHRLEMPDGVLALLAQQHAPENALLSTRRHYMSRYASFMSSHPGWASVGVGTLYSS